MSRPPLSMSFSIVVPNWQLICQAYRLNWDTWLGHGVDWLWGSQIPEYDTVAKKAIELPANEVPSEAAVKELIEFSDKVKDKAVASNTFNFRWFTDNACFRKAN